MAAARYTPLMPPADVPDTTSTTTFVRTCVSASSRWSNDQYVAAASVSAKSCDSWFRS
ncbi:MAG: hypothetical protein H0V33_01630 [Acidimicrobiia bacterium]|nr:hypothetical protein [Acidimicrobiia bacterium]